MLSSFYTYENESQISVDLKCSICLDPFQSPFCDDHCGHRFCFQCLKTWLRQKQSCPICRRYFTKFVSITDETVRQKLDDLLVQCVHCNETNIKRGTFNDHLTYRCTKRIVTDQEETKKNLEERLNFEYFLIKINQSTENSRRQQNYEQFNFNVLPMWVIIMFSINIFIYLSVLIPIALVLYIIDLIFCPILHAIFYLIHFRKLQRQNL